MTRSSSVSSFASASSGGTWSPRTGAALGPRRLVAGWKSPSVWAAAAGAWPLLEIDVEGALNVMRAFPDVLSIFLTTPEAEYEQRLRARGTESEEVIQRRLQTARNELQSAASYAYTVVNDDLDRAVREICSIIAQREAGLHAG